MKYPIYIPTKGRFEKNLTADLLIKYNIDFRLFVEDNEYSEYEKRFGSNKLVMLDGHDFGGVGYARNFILEYSIKRNEKRHWQLDDDIKAIYKLNQGVNTECSPIEAFTAAENLTEQYTNIGLTGLSANTFVKFSRKPYEINRFAYTCFLMNNSMPYRFRKELEEDLDINLQVLTGGLCTIKINMYNFAWASTGTRKGGWTELNANNKRKIRMLKTIDQWPFIPGIVRKGEHNFRLKTEMIWRRFNTSPIPHD